MMPGTASFLMASSGTHQEWMTSLDVISNRTLAPFGTIIGRSTSSRKFSTSNGSMPESFGRASTLARSRLE
jgi:hypothetical protein